MRSALLLGLLPSPALALAAVQREPISVRPEPGSRLSDEEELAAISFRGHLTPRHAYDAALTAENHFPGRSGDNPFDAHLPPIFKMRDLEGNKALDTVHGVAEHLVTPGMGLLVFIILVGACLGLNKWTAPIPQSAWTVFFSAMFGFFVRGLLNAGVITGHKYVWASATFLNLFLLPVIIFESGWALNHFNFLSQIEYIGIFAVFGTLISFFFVGLAGYMLGAYGFLVVRDLREHLAFAALISAVDPVATLSTFSKLGLDSRQPLLHTMIFGESVINDAVAIVLFHTINSSWEELTVLHCVGKIAVLLFGSAGFGVLFSSLLVWFLRVARLPGNTIPETLYIIASAWLTFSAAEGSGLSGIIANLCAGSVFRLYGARHLESSGLRMTTEYLEVSAHLMDNMVFVLCGVSTALVDSFRGLKFATSGLVLCLLGRAASTSLCAMACNGIKWYMQEPKSHFITIGHQCIMWQAGLRGGIALVLALELDASWCHHKATIINGTFIIICATLLLLGSTTEPLLRVLDLIKAEETGDEEAKDGDPPRQVTATLLDEMQADNSQGMKRGMLKGIHQVFEFILVGDLGRGQEKRERRRAFVEAMRGVVLETAHGLQKRIRSKDHGAESVDAGGSPAA